MDSAIARAGSTATTRNPSLPAAIDASRHDYVSRLGGRIHYYADTSATGRPLVLIHSINAAPSAFEMKPLFEHYRSQRPVFALDLPGFGHSDRSNRRYSPELFAGVIAEFLETIVKSTADLIAFSLGCEFAARATLMKPELVASLALLSPTGFNIRGLPTGKAAERAHKALSVPVINDGLFGLLTTRPSIKYFYNQVFKGAIPPGLVDYAHATTHQPGAKYAPLYFLSGQLFTPKAGDTLYGKLTQPVLVVYDKDPNIDFHELPGFLSRHPGWRAEQLTPTRGMPQWEKPAETAAAIDRFWSTLKTD
ncbi:alpha/beta fold hydrolase [Thiocystis violascens]|uniref:Putative hydrolase or acyltransferase of alpha/beta superfamily n=1 Tax=Thiocystis violascens (strain ATCC 17096 / DSM 198 / 6111) TaxID=765911 RepID=I3YDG6_THIV6|nr:alpha/beta hydrolase [Thiocystis violascens]AFL75034.1 putative hydrolase or acyltransferase of alpha/beta superfamily [Thiocystis violascens DSM 198]